MDLSHPHDILLASNDDEQCAAFRDIFSGDGSFTLHVAASLPEILRVLSDTAVHCIIQGQKIERLSGPELRVVLREIVPYIPVLLHQRRRGLFRCGGGRRWTRRDFFLVLTGTPDPDRIKSAVQKAIRDAALRQTHRPLRGHRFYSPSYNEERMLVLQTALDILNNDAKDLFIRILSLLSDIPENEYTGILNDYINELYDCTSEALGYMRSEKRIEPLIDIINNIKLGSTKIPLPSESRLELSYGPRKLLFVEVSRLVKNALGNIVENALKFSPEDSKVEVRIEQTGTWVTLTISDHGAGIPPDIRRRLFSRHPARETSEQFQETGKGLWIASNIVKDEEGEISLSDNPGGGTVAVVRLPAFSLQRTHHDLSELSAWFKLPLEVVEKKARIMKTILRMELPPDVRDLDSLAFANLLDHFRDERRKKERQKYFFKLQEFTRYNPAGTRVLLVDDSLFVHYTIAPLLTDQGFHVVDFAFNGVEAGNLYEIFKPALVVMDITMPVKSGIETAEEIFRKNPRARILFVSALGDHQPLLDNLDRRFHGLRYATLSKPIRTARLLEAVNSLLSDQES